MKTTQQRMALINHCRLACETADPKFRFHSPHVKGATIVLTVNSGYE